MHKPTQPPGGFGPGPAAEPSWRTRCREWLFGIESDVIPEPPSDVEYPWQRQWDYLPKRTAGPGFTFADYDAARRRAEEVARSTLGDELWDKVQDEGHLDLESHIFPGVTYRLRIGRRIEVMCEPGVRPPWRYDYLCINPTYPLPEAEFFAHLYLYVRDHEEEIVRVAAPQPWDQALGRTF